LNYKEIVRRRDKVCQYCGTKGGKGNKLTVHHIKPRCQGGLSVPENCILLCTKCHRELHKENGYPTKKRTGRKNN